MLAKEVLFCLGQGSSPFCSGYFGDEVLPTNFPGWSRTSILEISASQVARITGVSHPYLASLELFSYLRSD
jgi:hypothetical protein